ncbi:MAG: YncE family protein [Rhizomicrobium sp.]
MIFKTAFLAAASLLLVATANAAPANLRYHLVKSVPLGAPDRWDYVVYDPISHHVFVAHGDKVSVVDGRTGAVIGNVEGMPGGTHGIGIVSQLNKGYTDDGKAGEAVAFNLQTLKVEKRIKAQDDADSIAFDPVSGHIFVVDGDSKVLTVIDPKTDQVVATVNGGGGLEYSVSGGNGKLYVNGAENKELVRIDTATNKADAHWPIPNCTSPHGLAIDQASHRLFVSCVNAVMTIVNSDNGDVVATLPIGRGTDAAAFDPQRKLAFSSNGVTGEITVIREIDPDHFVVAGEIKSPVSGRTMGIDPDTGRLFLAAADIDPNAPVPPGRNGRPGRPKLVPGSLKLLFYDPQS